MDNLSVKTTQKLVACLRGVSQVSLNGVVGSKFWDSPVARFGGYMFLYMFGIPLLLIALIFLFLFLFQ